MDALIFKIAPTALWREAEAAGFFRGAPVDIEDGYIHFSTAGQVRETAAKYFASDGDLVLAAVVVATLQDIGLKLAWEPARGGALFPHLYGALPMAAVKWAKPLPLGANGHIFPDLDR